MRKLMTSMAVLMLVPALSMAGTGKDKMEGYGSRGVDAAAGANPSGTDGCGLGWQVTQKKTMLGTTIRGTTNAVVPPTFGMTSGTMGCDQHSIAKKDMDAAKFAFNNQESLSIEMAQGQGEYLAGFAKTLGCEDQVQADFAKMTQENYANIVGEGQSALSLLHNVKAQIKKHPVLAESCRA
ncbi:DUF3015 domain-containing protein [bacterium]|nr:DUF3015 domain-containing protein [bacterium]NBW98401.1 DUF3015 domain-containing protein [bacterium]NBX81908.1 DUF3015 domain-containing protein [bacterium]